MDLILHATPRLAHKLSVDGAHDAARGILTTDHQAKEVLFEGSTFTLGAGLKFGAVPSLAYTRYTCGARVSGCHEYVFTAAMSKSGSSP